MNTFTTGFHEKFPKVLFGLLSVELNPNKVKGGGDAIGNEEVGDNDNFFFGQENRNAGQEFNQPYD